MMLGTNSESFDRIHPPLLSLSLFALDLYISSLSFPNHITSLPFLFAIECEKERDAFYLDAGLCCVEKEKGSKSKGDKGGDVASGGDFGDQTKKRILLDKEDGKTGHLAKDGERRGDDLIV